MCCAPKSLDGRNLSAPFQSCGTILIYMVCHWWNHRYGVYGCPRVENPLNIATLRSFQTWKHTYFIKEHTILWLTRQKADSLVTKAVTNYLYTGHDLNMLLFSLWIEGLGRSGISYKTKTLIIKLLRSFYIKQNNFNKIFSTRD